jgi:hypothetical protein
MVFEAGSKLLRGCACIVFDGELRESLLLAGGIGCLCFGLAPLLNLGLSFGSSKAIDAGPFAKCFAEILIFMRRVELDFLLCNFAALDAVLLLERVDLGDEAVEHGLDLRAAEEFFGALGEEDDFDFVGEGGELAVGGFVDGEFEVLVFAGDLEADVAASLGGGGRDDEAGGAVVGGDVAGFGDGLAAVEVGEGDSDGGERVVMGWCGRW